MKRRRDDLAAKKQKMKEARADGEKSKAEEENFAAVGFEIPEKQWPTAKP